MRIVPFVLAALLVAPPALAQMVLSKVALEFTAGGAIRDDIEVTNGGSETLYVQVEPNRIHDPGTPQERRVVYRDPAELGLLITPSRLVIPPGQTAIVRIAVVEPAREADRVYRLTVRPVVGDVRSVETAIKVVIAYDVLAIVRPPNPKADLKTVRTGRSMTLSNTGNSSILLTQGKQCDAAGANCQTLPPYRLYPGNEVTRADLPYDTPVSYTTTFLGQVADVKF